MSDNKKYYYLKLKENFFDSDALILLETMQDGYLYSNILLKLYLRSLKNEGKLMFNELIPYSPSMLASVTRHQIGTVEKALSIFRDMGLIEVLDNGSIYMLDIQNFIGKSSTEADRKRDYRQRINNEKNQLSLPSGQTSGQTDGQMSRQTGDKNPPEIEIEKEIDIEIEKEKSDSPAKQQSKNYTEEPLFQRFIALWRRYPNKQERKTAYKHYKIAVKSGTTDEEIGAGIDRYIRYVEYRRSTDFPGLSYKNGDTFFSKRSWESEYEIPNQTVNNAAQKTNASAQADNRLNAKEQADLDEYIQQVIKNATVNGKRNYNAIYSGLMKIEGRKPFFTEDYIEKLYDQYTAL